jgi:hypothetical protein
MRLRHPAPNIGVPPWAGTGTIIRAGAVVRPHHQTHNI